MPALCLGMAPRQKGFSASGNETGHRRGREGGRSRVEVLGLSGVGMSVDADSGFEHCVAVDGGAWDAKALPRFGGVYLLADVDRRASEALA